MGKKLRFWAGAAFGAALQYFYDPTAGQSRRVVLWERITDLVFDSKGDTVHDAPVSRIDHLSLWRSEPRRSAGRIV